MRHLLVIYLIFFSIYKLHGTHLVGGEMNYQYLGGEEYEITLTVYRDCYLGEADYDYPAYVSVYDGFRGQFLGVFPVYGQPRTNLPVELDHECYTAPPNVCVEKMEYNFIGELPENEHGYYLSYQRCCRNKSIVNIIDDKTDDPGDSGMNLYAYIPPVNKIQNSNPIFHSYPPVAICVNMPLVFDHGAYDLDGDSLVYKICMPTDALSPEYPAFNWSNYDEFPFDDVRFRHPYSLDDVLGGEEKLQIDSETGLLTGHPNRVGQYVVGVCVEEYREGELVSITKRDFQFNVAECGKSAVAAFFSMDTICNTLDVNFKNESIGADQFQWIINDKDTLETKDLKYSFSSYGLQNVTLIAENRTGCKDTITKEIFLKEDDFKFAIKNVDVCKGEAAELVIESTQSETIKSVYWKTQPPAYTDDGTHSYYPTYTETVVFEIATSEGCQYDGSVRVRVLEAPHANIEASKTELYSPQSITVKSTQADTYEYSWNATGELSEPHNHETDIYIEQSQWIYLSVSHLVNSCIARDSIFIEIKECETESLYTSQESVKNFCDHALYSVQLETEEDDLNFRWIVGDDTIQGGFIELQVEYDSLYTIYLEAEREELCSEVIEKVFEVKKPLVYRTNPVQYLCESAEVVLVNWGIETQDDYYIIINQQDTIYNQDFFRTAVIGEDWTWPFSIHYGDSCVIHDSIQFRSSQAHVEAHAQPTVVYKGGEVSLSATPSDYPTYQWYPDYLPVTPDEAQTTATLDETTEFIVEIMDEHGCIAQDTILVTVINKCDEEDIFVPTAFSPNGDGVNDIWQVRTEIPVQIHVAIYNRWGEKVFESHDIQHAWDGTYKGRVADAGSYAYYMTVVCENEQQFFTKGNITLLK